MAADDYISREEAIKTVTNYKWNFCPKNMRDWATKLKRAVCSDVCSDLAKLPPADVRENAPGTWTRVDYEPVGHDYTCSVCQRKNAEPSKFCPNCGADMRRAKLKTGEKYVLKKNTGDLEAGETVVVERVNVHQGDEFTYCVKISSDSRPGYWGFDYIQPGEEPEVVGNRERAVL